MSLAHFTDVLIENVGKSINFSSFYKGNFVLIYFRKVLVYSCSDRRAAPIDIGFNRVLRVLTIFYFFQHDLL